MQILEIVLLFNIIIGYRSELKYKNTQHYEFEFKNYSKALLKLKKEISQFGSQKILVNKYKEFIGENYKDLIVIKLLNQNLDSNDNVIIIFKIGNLFSSLRHGYKIILNDEDILRSADFDELIKNSKLFDNLCPLPLYKEKLPENIEYCTYFMKSGENIIKKYSTAENLYSKNNLVKSCIETNIIIKQPNYKFKCFKTGLTSGWEEISKKIFKKNILQSEINKKNEYIKNGKKHIVKTQKEFQNKESII